MTKDIETVRRRIRSTLPTKNNPLYNSNMYWSQKPYNICDILIEELSNKGDTVFDPFMGSGVTILESVRSKYSRKAIGCEINEAPLNIVKTLLNNYDFQEFENDSTKIINKINELNKYYDTTCPICGAKAKITSTIFDLPTRDASPIINCINIDCPHCKKTKKTKDFNFDLSKMTKKYKLTNINFEKMLPNSKLAVHKNQTVEEIFTNRNLFILDEIIGIVENSEYTDVYKYILMSVLHLCKITDTHSNSQWPLWIPKTNCVEKNVVDMYCKKIKNFKKTITYINSEYADVKDVSLLHKGSQNITDFDIPDCSVNLIITDPPYLGQVAYSEYMQLYKPFLNYDYNLNDEIIVTSTPNRKIDKKEYFDLLNEVFRICSKKIVDGGYLCMYFHDTNLDVWNNLIKIMANNQFKYLCQEHIKKTNTLKNIISPKKSLNGDAVLFFVKENFKYKEYDPKETFEEIENNLITEIKEIIRVKGPSSTTSLYDGGIIEYLVYNGWLNIVSSKYKTLVDVFEKCLIWDENANLWKL